MVSSSDIEIISNATIDPAGDRDCYTQIMKHLGNKKLLIVAKTVTDFETTIKNMITIVLFVLGNCFTADRLCTWLTHIEANCATYWHCSDLDIRFFAHQLTIMDNMIQAFWRNSNLFMTWIPSLRLFAATTTDSGGQCHDLTTTSSGHSTFSTLQGKLGRAIRGTISLKPSCRKPTTWSSFTGQV